MISYAEIDELLDHANHNNQAKEQEEIVNLDSASEEGDFDMAAIDMAEVHEMAEVHVPAAKEQPNKVENGDDANSNDSAGNENEFGVEDKENVRPQSTPIAKSEAPVDSPKVIAAMASTSSAVVMCPFGALPTAPTVANVPPNPPAQVEQPVVVTTEANDAKAVAPSKTTEPPQPTAPSKAAAPSNANVQPKMYLCPFCDDDELFTSKLSLQDHLNTVHRKKKKTEKPGKLVRAPSSLKRNRDATEEDTDPSEDTQVNVLVQKGATHFWSNPMNQAMKRYKKIAKKE